MLSSVIKASPFSYLQMGHWEGCCFIGRRSWGQQSSRGRGWLRRSGLLMSQDVECGLNRFWVNVRTLLIKQTLLFQALGFQCERLFPRPGFLLNTLTGFQTHRTCLFGLFSIALSSCLRFPDAQPLSQQFGAIRLSPEFSFFKQVDHRNVPSIKENIDFSSTKPIQKSWADITIS